MAIQMNPVLAPELRETRSLLDTRITVKVIEEKQAVKLLKVI